jgi:hypothetical protein
VAEFAEQLPFGPAPGKLLLGFVVQHASAINIATGMKRAAVTRARSDDRDDFMF